MEDDQFVGIDVSGDYLDMHVHPIGCTCRVSNDSAGMKELLKKLSDYDVALIVVEATGGLQRGCAAFLTSAGYAVSVANPRQVRDFACSRRPTELMPTSLPGSVRLLDQKVELLLKKREIA